MRFEDGRFHEKVVVITGGAIGFGRSFARAFVAEGAAVVIADIDAEGGERTASELREAGGRAIAVRCDVADEAQVEAAVATTVAELGGVDVLINNAGLHLMRYNQPFSVMPRSDLRALFDVNVFGVVNCTTACRASMAERGGGALRARPGSGQFLARDAGWAAEPSGRLSPEFDPARNFGARLY